MTNRREFLQIGLLACASGSLPLGSLAHAGPVSVPAKPLQAVLQDLRYPAAAEHVGGLLEQLASTGHNASGNLAIKGLDGELLRLWFEARQRGECLSLAGTTGADVLFCLEQLGRDAGLRVLWRSNHGNQDDGSGAQALYSWILADPQSWKVTDNHQTLEFA